MDGALLEQVRGTLIAIPPPLLLPIGHAHQSAAALEMELRDLISSVGAAFSWFF
jgi:hypothetical protein